MSSKNIDSHGQPLNAAFNFNRNREKAAYSLRGLLQGLVADEKLDNQELLFLDAWLKSQQELDDGDVVDLLNLIGDVLEDGIITSDELQELMEVINDIIEYGQQSSSEVEATINELLGFLLGIAADGKVTKEELENLESWLKQNKHIAECWPTNELIKRINNIYADGIVTKEELDDLLETVKQMSGYDFEETGSADGGVAEVFSDETCEFNHQDNTICFTGKFVCGTRSVVENSAKEKGANITKSITKKLNTLVIGTLASRDWRFTSHGRKIEKVLELKQNGAEIVILSERHWLKLTNGT